MDNAKDENGELLPDEQRRTVFGNWLRATSIDELPCLLNVIKGEMSLVGPRPLPTEYDVLYSDLQARRSEVLPGVTGMAQINGRNVLSWEERFELDVWYVKNKSFLLDLKIIILTIVKVLMCQNVNTDDNKSMPPFKGSIGHEVKKN